MTRGSEIVYCYKCAVRVTGRDLDSGSALRFADFYSCAACARALFDSLSPRRQKIIADRIEQTVGAALRPRPGRQADSR